MDGRDRDSSLSSTIVEAIAAVDGVEPTEMEPLYTAVNIDALDQLFESLRRSAHQNGDERVEFTFDGHRVAVLASGDITVRRDSEDVTHDEPTGEAAFKLALSHLLREATANGVDVEGGWACQNESDSKWGIEIYEVSDR